MRNMALLEAFAEKAELFKQGAVILAKEAKDNGYKLNTQGLTLFIDDCEDKIGIETANFYRLCIPYAIKE